MAKLKISLSHLGDKGSVAKIEDGSNSTVLIDKKIDKNPSETCAKAATKLRELADAFDRLSLMPDLYLEKSQNKAMRVPK